MRTHRLTKSVLLVGTLLLLLVVSSLTTLAESSRTFGEQTGSATHRGQIYDLPDISIDELPAQLVGKDPLGIREPQVVIGPDSRVQVTDTTVHPYNKIVSIWAGDPNTGDGFGCTGTFIGSRVILTAAHCVWFPEFNGYPGAVVVTPGQNGTVEPYGRENASNLWAPQGWIDANGDINAAPQWDYALIILGSNTLGNTVGTMTIGVLNDVDLAAANFNPTTAGYPGDKPEGTMWTGTQPSFTSVQADFLEHEIDSFQGQSGSAVWRASDELIVGIESSETETPAINISRRITQAVVNDYLGVCQQLNCTFNVAGAAGGDSAAQFKRVRDRTDLPVETGQISRTWMWGPQANTMVMQEQYLEAPGNQRDVQYFDKSRMEITNPAGDSNSIWFVTNGLLSTELITGRLQLGDNTFEQHNPAVVNVAGDANDPNGPTYQTFGQRLNDPPLAVDTTITQRIGRAGTVTTDPTLAGQGVTVGAMDDVTNHSIAAPFWNFMNSSGLVWDGQNYVQAQLFENPFFATGRPITEPYWANVLVGGQDKLVLIQCFERRCLTFTPDNAPTWQVEAGNVGQHYFTWRYQQIPNE